VSTRCGDGVCGSDEDRATCADDCTVVAGCAGAETYVRYDDAARTFETRVEALSATWFATGGAFEVARNGVKDAESDRVENAWTAPDAPGTLWLWAVLRDERGGVSFDARRLVVAP
jgi:hypothetical protein